MIIYKSSLFTIRIEFPCSKKSFKNSHLHNTRPQSSHSLPTPPKQPSTNPQSSHSLPTPPKQPPQGHSLALITTPPKQPSKATVLALITHAAKTTFHKATVLALITHAAKTTFHKATVLALITHAAKTPSTGHSPRTHTHAPKQPSTRPQSSHSLPTPPKQPPQGHSPRTHYPRRQNNLHKATVLALITHARQNNLPQGHSPRTHYPTPKKPPQGHSPRTHYPQPPKTQQHHYPQCCTSTFSYGIHPSPQTSNLKSTVIAFISHATIDRVAFKLSVGLHILVSFSKS
ncbi:hypothetical protein HNY73_021089 [Argiope bruennichi]|uniref:Uncharacterized protein n=1 Tax=Argiope bruennichi TaxID=94029 RepID=A0A8T0E8U1_ARGBR|nr:hypothetical protein HNY73_021089 [Argiope bruennichi]